MTNHEINRAIAEACGWKDLENEDFSEYGVPCFMLMGSNNTGTRLAPPDYCHDLNAMHEAEQLLWNKNWSLRHEFVNHLARIINPVHGYRMQEAIDLLDATARQRAEAFLKTIEKFN